MLMFSVPRESEIFQRIISETLTPGDLKMIHTFWILHFLTENYGFFSSFPAIFR